MTDIQKAIAGMLKSIEAAKAAGNTAAVAEYERRIALLRAKN